MRIFSAFFKLRNIPAHLHIFLFFFRLLLYWKQFARDWFWCYAALWIPSHLKDIWAWDRVFMQGCAKLWVSTLNRTTLLLSHKKAILPMAVTAQMSPLWDSFYLLWKQTGPGDSVRAKLQATAWATAGLDSTKLPWEVTVCICFCYETTVLIELETHQEIKPQSRICFLTFPWRHAEVQNF